MQSSLASLPTFLPLSPAEEEIRLLQPLTSIQIKNDLDKVEILKNGVLLLTTKKAIWYNEHRGFFFFYQNAISHGYQGFNLICMINFANENEEENFKGACMNEEVGQEGGEDGEEEEDYVFEKVLLFFFLFSFFHASFYAIFYFIFFFLKNQAFLKKRTK